MKAKFSFMQRFSDFIISPAIKPQGQPTLDSFAKPAPQGKIAPFGRKAKSTKLHTFHLTGKPNSQNDRYPTLPQPTKTICQGSLPHLLFFNAQITPRQLPAYLQRQNDSFLVLRFSIAQNCTKCLTSRIQPMIPI